MVGGIPVFGEFQCYDQYLLKSLRKATEARGHSFWGRGPDNAGSYNSGPNETGFFSDGGEYDGYYGRFFLNWYSRVLVDHGDRVLSLAKLAFDGTCIAARATNIFKLPTVAGARNLGENNIFVAVALALRNALLLAKGRGLENVCVEGDSKLVIDVITSFLIRL